MNIKTSKINKFFENSKLLSLLGDISHAVSLERLGPKVTDRVIWRAAIAEPKIALTFDDGPQSDTTPRLLEILNKFDVKATLFLIGQNIETHFDLACEIVKAGHEVANHTFSHFNMLRLDSERLIEEIKHTDTLLRSLKGAAPKFLRPPMGLFSKRVLDIVEQAGYETVIGDVYPRDSHLPGKDKILQRVLKRVTAGSIIILHDGGNSHNLDRSQTLWAVERMIPQLQDRGFEFVTISKLLL